MNTNTFITKLVGDVGHYYCLWAKKNKTIRQTFHKTVEDLVENALILDVARYDTYFGLGTFGVPENREASNVVQMQSLYVDLDCGAEKAKHNKGYATQAEALQALKQFCKQHQLPKPAVVNSGYGIHAYWPLTTVLSRAEWLPLATKFKAFCTKQGLLIDPAATADAARVLRIPGTHNYKYKTQVDVALLTPEFTATSVDLIRERLGIVQEPPVVLPLPIAAGADQMMHDLTGSHGTTFRTIVLKTALGKGCAQIGHLLVDQAVISEPLWRAGLSIAQFCEDRVIAIHKLSKDYPGYSREETEAKAERIKGPYLCERFNQDSPNLCDKCAHYGKIKSPITLGHTIIEAKPEDNVIVQQPVAVPQAPPQRYVIPTYPKPYFRGRGGGVFKTIKDEDEPKLVYPNDIYVVKRLRDPELGESLVIRLHLPKDGVREFTIPLTIVGSKDELRKGLAVYGVALIDMTEMAGYLMKWTNELQHVSEAEEARKQFGWVEDSDEMGFAVGDVVVYQDRIEVNAPSAATASLVKAFDAAGTIEDWVSITEFYNRPDMEPHQFMIGLSFAAPLMQFQPINAAAFHMYSRDSGLGKTTGMLVGSSVWGNPDQLLLQERDTYNSKMNRAEVYKNLPVYMDEMTNTKPQDLSDWAYQLPSGMQRNRMGGKGNQERVRGKPWKTIFGTTGNTSVIERISTYKALPKAEAQRVLEYAVTKMDFDTKEETDLLVAQIKNNYGHAGVIYLQYVMTHLDEVLSLADSVQRRIDAEAGLKAENRFWSVLVSRVVTGIMVARSAGLLNWKVKPLVDWVVSLVMQSKNTVEDMDGSVAGIINDYITENYDNILRIKSTTDLRNKDVEMIIAPEVTPRGQLIARYEYDIKRLYLLPKPFKQWCGEKQINYSWVIKELKEAPTNMQQLSMRITKGVNLHLPTARTLCIDCSSFIDSSAPAVV